MITRHTFLAACLLIGTGLIVASSAATSQAFRGHNSRAPIALNADRIVVLERTNRAILSGNVRVRQGDMTLTAGQIVVAYTGGGAGSVSRMDATGGVTVQRGNETARSSFATYEPNRRIISLAGGIVLNQGGNTMRGGRLLIDLNSGRAVVDGRGGASPNPADPNAPTTGRVSGRFSVSGK
jgi:lipopolysaccharide export system protein LptA